MKGKVAVVAVKIVGTLLCLLVPSMLVHKVWWLNRDKQHWEGQGEHEKERKSVWSKCPNYFCLRLWVVEQDFHGNFRVNVTWFFTFFSGVLDWIKLILVLFERSLHCAHVSGQSCPWLLKLMTSQAVEGTWIRKDGYGRPRGEWVKNRLLPIFSSDFTLNGQIGLFHPEKWFFSKSLVLCLKYNSK